METQTLACSANWLETTLPQGSLTQSNVFSGFVTSNCLGQYTGGWTYPYYLVTSSPARPIKLTLSEIERLRKAAKADKALKEILSKFTDQIEITVDFE